MLVEVRSDVDAVPVALTHIHLPPRIMQVCQVGLQASTVAVVEKLEAVTRRLPQICQWDFVLNDTRMTLTVHL